MWLGFNNRFHLCLPTVKLNQKPFVTFIHHKWRFAKLTALGARLNRKNKTNNTRQMMVDVWIIKEFIILTPTKRFEIRIKIVNNPNSKGFYILLNTLYHDHCTNYKSQALLKKSVIVIKFHWFEYIEFVIQIRNPNEAAVTARDVHANEWLVYYYQTCLYKTLVWGWERIGLTKWSLKP